jgi:hypothetical protein
MSELLKKVDNDTYTFGNYRITHEDGYWFLHPITPIVHGWKTWLEGTIRCNTRDDAFRIANVFTGEEVIASGMRDVMKFVIDEGKEKSA